MHGCIQVGPPRPLLRMPLTLAVVEIYPSLQSETAAQIETLLLLSQPTAGNATPDSLAMQRPGASVPLAVWTIADMQRSD